VFTRHTGIGFSERVVIFRVVFYNYMLRWDLRVLVVILLFI
jgi:hypothetical protein